MTRARELADLGKQGGISVGTSAPGSTGGYMIGVGLSAGGVPSRQLDVASGDCVVGSAITFGGNSGIVSATAFHGDGSNLSGTDPAGISTTGFSTFTQIAASGIVTVTNTTAATSATTGSLVISGGVGIGKSLYVDGGISVAGTVTYNDVTNVDSVGIVTAGKGIRVTAGGIVVTAGVSTLATVSATTINAGAGVTVTASGIVNAGFTTITGATETVTGVTTYPVPDSSNTKVTIECDAAKGTLFSHNMSNGNVGIVSLTSLPVRGNSFTTYTIIFTQLSSTPVGTGNTLPKNGIGTNVYLNGGFTGFSTQGRVATASTVTLSTTASDIDIVTFGVHYNGSGTAGKENFKVLVTGNTGFRIGND